jgi:hypothetical protein
MFQLVMWGKLGVKQNLGKNDNLVKKQQILHKLRGPRPTWTTA